MQEVNDFLSNSGRKTAFQDVNDNNIRSVNLVNQELMEAHILGVHTEQHPQARVIDLSDDLHLTQGENNTGCLPLLPEKGFLPEPSTVQAAAHPASPADKYQTATVGGRQGKELELTCENRGFDQAGCSLSSRQLPPTFAEIGGNQDFLQQPMSWAKVVSKDSLQPKINLRFFPPILNNGTILVKPPAEVLQHGNSMWSTCLAGRFIHSKLPFKLVEETAFKLWGQYGLSKVFLHDQEYFLFKFTSVEECNNVVALGPWYMANKLIKLHLWTEGFDFSQEDLSKAPVWVKFHHIPLSYWTTDGLSYLASAIGKPLFVDKQTGKMEPMNFARICIEIQASSLLPDSIFVSTLHGTANLEKLMEVKVEYQNKPPSCSVCQVFGHSHLKCPKANFQWIPKVPKDPTTTPIPRVNAGIAEGKSSHQEHHETQNDNTLPEWTVVMKGPKTQPPSSKIPVEALIQGSKLCTPKTLGKDQIGASINSFSPIAGKEGMVSSDDDSPLLIL